MEQYNSTTHKKIKEQNYQQCIQAIKTLEDILLIPKTIFNNIMKSLFSLPLSVQTSFSLHRHSSSQTFG